MPTTARIDEIVDAMEIQDDELPSYLDLDSGEVLTVSREILREVEECPDDEEPDVLEWQEREVEPAQRILFSGRVLRLPGKFDIHEWDIMHDFAEAVEPQRIQEDLLYALRGRGAFGHFKDAVHRHRIEKDWYAFRTEAFRQIAIDWCEENEIAWR